MSTALLWPVALDSTLDPRQKVVAVAIALVILTAIVELLRRRKLREEYSAIWFVTALVLMALALEPALLSWFAGIIGAKLGTSALFFGALMFLMLLSLLMTLRLSRLTFRAKALARQCALADAELEELRAEVAELRRHLARSRVADLKKDDVA